MSQASFVSEPTTNGKVVISTTVGDFDVELWSRECPLACRHFVQLCLDGYYNNCTFYSVHDKVAALTGDPSDTGAGGINAFTDPTLAPALAKAAAAAAAMGGGATGEDDDLTSAVSTPWSRAATADAAKHSSGAGAASTFFKTESHSRLRFTRPGLVALSGPPPFPADPRSHVPSVPTSASSAASLGKVGTDGEGNSSKFLFTLGPCRWLDNKRTIFGSITGDTRFNLNYFSSGSGGDAGERRVVRIKSTTVVNNPFPTLVPTVPAAESDQSQSKVAADAKAKGTASSAKGGAAKKKAILSFDGGFGDDEDDGGETFVKKKKARTGGSIFDAEASLSSSSAVPAPAAAPAPAAPAPAPAPTPAVAPAPVPAPASSTAPAASSSSSSSGSGSAVAALRARFLSRKAQSQPQRASSSEDREDRTMAMLAAFMGKSKGAGSGKGGKAAGSGGDSEEDDGEDWRGRKFMPHRRPDDRE